MNQVVALVDCNSFYVSCEKVFHPFLKNEPVVVLSNNDGCVISRSNEVKKLGMSVGAPIFKYQNLIKSHKIKVFSANFVLYGDMSNRVMSVLSHYTPQMEVYSIDEAFLSLDGFEHLGLEAYGRTIRAGVKKQTGIPVSVGIAPTKTLAKIANHYAKDHSETNGVFCLIDEPTIDHYLKQTPVGEIWGIGREKVIFLNQHGILTALQLKNAKDEWIKKHLTVTTLRTVWELRGTPCLSLEDAPLSKKAISTTRTFGREVNRLEDLEEAMASHVSRAAEKLRDQESMAGYVQVYIETNRFKGSYYRNSAGIDLSPPTAYTPQLIHAAKKLLKQIYQQGFHYKGCGVWLMNLSTQTSGQEYLFDEKYAGSARERLMKVMDTYNQKTNSGNLFLAAEGLEKEWHMEQTYRSKRFTTRWDEVLEIKI
jgi:DNA polymerase V